MKKSNMIGTLAATLVVAFTTAANAAPVRFDFRVTPSDGSEVVPLPFGDTVTGDNGAEVAVLPFGGTGNRLDFYILDPAGSGPTSANDPDTGANIGIFFRGDTSSAMVEFDFGRPVNLLSMEFLLRSEPNAGVDITVGFAGLDRVFLEPEGEPYPVARTVLFTDPRTDPLIGVSASTGAFSLVAITVDIAPVPLPAGGLLLLGGIGALAAGAARKRSRASPG